MNVGTCWEQEYNRPNCLSVEKAPKSDLYLYLLAQAIFEPNLFPYEYPNILNPSHSSHLLAYEDGTDSVPKCWHVKFRHRGITTKKAQNKQKLLNPSDYCYAGILSLTFSLTLWVTVMFPILANARTVTPFVIVKRKYLPKELPSGITCKCNVKG